MLNIVKTALRITGIAFDAELQLLINDCLCELQGLGITNLVRTIDGVDFFDFQVQTTVIAYCKWKFGDNENKAEWENIYHQKVAQLKTMSGHTDWGDGNG